MSIGIETPVGIALTGGKEPDGAGKTEGKTVSASSGFLQTFQSGIREVSMDSIFEEAADRYQIPAKLLRAVAKAESGFDPNAVSKAGAMGVMQLMPDTARGLGVTDPFDARQNIMAGARYLKENLEEFQDVELALAAYNAGPGKVKKYGGIPPYKETQDYVKKVMNYMGEPTLLAGRTVTDGGATKSGGYGGLFLSSFAAADLIQLFRIQMMMEAGREIGRMEIGEV